VEHHPQPPTIAILGAATVVGRALCALLEDSGYKTRPLDAYPTGVVDELLEGANLLLLAPRVDEGVREAFVGAMGKRTPQRSSIPVIALTTALEEDLPEKEGVIRVPWPTETKVLIERIEAALLDAPAASTAASTEDLVWPS
jgi:nucleoside-diphosphate-sugar epimerase